MVVVQLFALLVFLAVVCFLPGWALLRRWIEDPVERAAVAPALSLGLASAGAFVIYIAALPGWSHWVVTAGLLLASVRGWPSAWGAVRQAGPRALLCALGLLALWLLGWQLLPRGYSGGAMFYDWIEHYLRSRLWADQWDRTMMWGPYQLPARPPLVNLACGYVMAQFGHGMPIYQATYALLSALALLPAALLARRWFGSGAVWAALLLLALNPMLVQNATFTWTRGPTTYFVLLTVWLYVRSLDHPVQVGRAAGVFVVGALSLLAHYSAAPYVIFLAAHLVWRVVRGGGCGWPAVLASGAAGAVVLAPWFGWSVLAFGQETTIGNNSTVATIAPLSAAQYLRESWVNLRDSLVAPMWDAFRIGMFHQENRLGFLRDRLFIVYQTNLWFGLGATNLLALAVVLWQRRWHRQGVGTAAGEAGFWWGFFPIVGVLGILVHGPKEHPLGLAHICLQPLIFVGVIWLAGWFARAGRGWRGLWLTGLALEAMGTIVLHFYIQSIPVTEAGRPEPGRVVFDRSAGLSHHTYANFEQKALHHLTFLGDQVAAYTGVVWLALALLFALMVRQAWRPPMHTAMPAGGGAPRVSAP